VITPASRVRLGRTELMRKICCTLKLVRRWAPKKDDRIELSDVRLRYREIFVAALLLS
jgi:hypothetical protein